MSYVSEADSEARLDATFVRLGATFVSQTACEPQVHLSTSSHLNRPEHSPFVCLIKYTRHESTLKSSTRERLFLGDDIVCVCVCCDSCSLLHELFVFPHTLQLRGARVDQGKMVHGRLGLVSLKLSNSGVDLLAILVETNTRRGQTVPASLTRTNTHNLGVNSARNTVCRLDVQLGESVLCANANAVSVSQSETRKSNRTSD